MNEFISVLAAADQRCRSWREKLDFVRELIAGETESPTSEQWAVIAIYLRFLGTGEIPCVEDGRHFRPSHHARIALEIQERLGTLTGPDAACIARRIYPWLPSSAQTFRRAEPLTRIRDIAHRNDIPAELKREIKHTLQNKLHRCAGPEDLAISAALLEKITAPGADYSPDFVGQFRIFHEELKEFFNARSLDDRLGTLRRVAGEPVAGLIDLFLEAKGAVAAPDRGVVLKRLTDLRQGVASWAGVPAATAAQERLLADIGLEDFAFVLLSERINQFEIASVETGWGELLQTLELIVINLALSGAEPEECQVIAAELQAWAREWQGASRHDLFRLKATLERGRRVAEDYSDRITRLFHAQAEPLGRALGVAAHAVRVFCDSEIRGHLCFQLAKLVSLMLHRCRERLGLPAWDVVVSGRAAGRVAIADQLDELAANPLEPVVAVLNHAAGDEEIPAGVSVVVLGHEIPHLSHLGVRARQAGVVLVACEERAQFEELRRLDGKMLLVRATPERVAWEISTQPTGAPAASQTPPRAVLSSSIKRSPEPSWLALEFIRADTGGGKAEGARRLAEIARRGGAGFQTPKGRVIPFGVLEAAWDQAPELNAVRQTLLGQINSLPPDAFAASAAQLQSLTQRLRVPVSLAGWLAQEFGPSARLMVRSSANCEDLEELAGAGLYDSVANVGIEEAPEAVRAVWASLWTRRAALSRKQAGLPHEQAQIAVLVQEMLNPDYSFVMHTVNPASRNPREICIEIAVGLGETLASAATRGNPYRLVCDKDSGEVTLRACASFSHALRPGTAGGVERHRVDYSRVELSRRPEALTLLGKRLAAIAGFVEAAFEQPQDIEGVVASDGIDLVQSRPQQGLREWNSE